MYCVDKLRLHMNMTGCPFYKTIIIKRFSGKMAKNVDGNIKRIKKKRTNISNLRFMDKFSMGCFLFFIENELYDLHRILFVSSWQI